MNRILSVLMGGVMAISLVACDTEAGQKQQVGTLLGAVGGALAGSAIGDGKGQMAAIAVGTLLGAGIGQEVGKSLDRADRLAMQQTMTSALERSPSGQSTTWRNPDSGNYGTYTPQPAYQTASNQTCREFQQTITVGGKQQSGYGTACRQPDGSWQIQN
ncbi:MAG: RT0821/Lpp0805 family surface protein [Pseudomonadota bacterium]